MDKGTKGKRVRMYNKVPCHEDVWGIFGTTLHIRDLGTVWRRWLVTSNKLLTFHVSTIVYT
jgi:hypothetical protein